MTIADIGGRGKELLAKIPPRVLILAILMLSTTLAFGLGILAGRDLERGHSGAQNPSDTGFWIETREQTPAAAVEAVETGVSGNRDASGSLVASKNGTKFYLPSCSGAARIKEANKVWFSSRQDAEAAGYSAAANCPGL